MEHKTLKTVSGGLILALLIALIAYVFKERRELS